MNSAIPIKPPRQDRSDPLRLVYLELVVPAQLCEPVRRHHDNLLLLSNALRTSGLPEEAITDQLEAAVSSYRDALITAINDLSR